jgi:DNA-binding response OmpR family regulator
MNQVLDTRDLSEAPSHDATPARLCLIDDDPDSIGLLIAFLRDYGLALNIASNGEDGLRAVRKHRPDLVLLDLHMPPPNGLQVLETLQAAGATRTIPVLMLTGLCDLDNKLAAFKRGAADYVTKPVEPQELHARVLAHLQRARREAAVLQRLHAYRSRFGVLEQPSDADPGTAPPHQEVKVLERAQRILRERMADPPSLSDLAAEVGQHRPHQILAIGEQGKEPVAVERQHRDPVPRPERGRPRLVQRRAGQAAGVAAVHGAQQDLPAILAALAHLEDAVGKQEDETARVALLE